MLKSALERVKLIIQQINWLSKKKVQYFSVKILESWDWFKMVE